MVLLFLLVFILGALTVVALEAAGLWVLIRRLNRKVEKEEIKEKYAPSVGSHADINPSLYNQGILWVLEQEKVPKIGLEDKVLIEQRKKKDILEVTPVRKSARIKDRYLIITEPDGSSVKIFLRDCTILAVSATSLSSRKWAKRYPIKVESKGSAIYKENKSIYIYLETSWEKESWCKALRFASCNDEEKKLWFSKLSSDFCNYLASLNVGYPSLMKPSGVPSAESIDKTAKFDNSSKVRQFLKRFGKKASAKGGQDYKASGIPVSGHEDRKLNEKFGSFQDPMHNSLAKMAATEKPHNVSFDDTSAASSISSSTDPGSRSFLSGISDADSDYKNFDEGALCLNLLISRLFFDVKTNPQILRSIQSRIQRGLSDMRIPNYVGEISCTAVHSGTLPPRILAMRVLPSDMTEVWALEIDVEYLGGTVLEIETRLEIKELEAEGEETHLDTNTVDEVTSDLLEDFECLEKQWKASEETTDEIKQKEGDHDSENEISKSTAAGSSSSRVPKWKSVLSSIAKQVSQVPISLKIQISSMRGTIRLSMKPPPSDQVWFGFTSMPDIGFNLESFIGGHKITNSHLAVYLISRFKAGVRETLVLPNTESIAIPWMLAEKDDWVPKKVAPFMWYKSNNQDSTNNTTKRVLPPSSQPSEATDTSAPSTSEPLNLEKSKSTGQTLKVTRVISNNCLFSIGESTSNAGSYQQPRTPSLEKDKLEELGSRSKKEDIPDIHVNSRSIALTEGDIHNNEEEDSRFKRLGTTRERMRGLGKKMGEKLEVRRRHIEEKGRNLVERMRAP